ncbi:hypothetical protein BDR07DRAFT_1488276 [Suillus spraguei]|nr:hypothetical protein BDR07DRAFT_1488276 [Suillus spraguei]
MAGSSKPTEKSCHLYSLLAHNALSGHQAFDSIKSDVRIDQQTRTDVYDCGLTIHRIVLVGVACSGIISCLCIVTGVVTLANHGVFGVTVISKLPRTRLPLQILTLTVNLIVTLCTESIGFVHDISLRSVLASESRLRFNTNLRLLTVARRWYSPNGTLLDGISAILLIISYSSASLVICLDLESRVMPQNRPSDGVAFAGLPLLIFGIAHLLQVTIVLSGIRGVKILTWSSSPFDLTAALVHHTQLTPTTLHCMRCVPDLETDGGPAKPLKIQPSAWHAHPSIRKVVIFLWGIFSACAGWAALVMYIWNKYAGTASYNALTIQLWSLFPKLNTVPKLESNLIAYFIPGVGLEVWILLFVNTAAVQGPLTLGLHCSELIANVIRDERQWRCATVRKGIITAANPVKTIFTHAICLLLFVAKPFLHWMFGLSFVGSTPAAYGKIESPMVYMFTAQNLCIALFIFACFFTFVALRRPRGPQPAAYGHVQTLANLVDEWSPVMWWGHKEDGLPYCHAGTSDHPLPDVKMDCIYAGSGAGSLVPLS